jgi:methionyl-tRNA formyltransferase
VQPHSVRRELAQLITTLDQYGPFDLGVVVAFGQILPPEILAYPRCGCVNIHASLLPRWRGAAPIQRAIEAGDTETGVCLMQMEAGLDTGPVYATARTPITAHDTGGSLHDTLAAQGAHLLTAHMQAIGAGTMTAIPQPAHGVTYAAKITAPECAVYWERSSDEISRAVRAFSPSPGSYSYLRGKRIKILSAESCSRQRSSVAREQLPGTVITTTPDQLEVACGTGTLRITALQVEGKRRMDAAEFLRGTPLVPGERFGEGLTPNARSTL